MSDPRPSSMPAGTALVVSLLIHVSAAGIAIGALEARAAPSGIERDTPPPEPPEDESAVLGLSESMAETVTWIGYEEYEEHLARLSEVEQAAMVEGPASGGGGGPTSAAAPPTPPQTPAALPGSARPSTTAPTPTAPAVETEKPEIAEASEIRIEPDAAPTDTPRESEPETPTEAPSTDNTPSDSPSTRPAEETTPRDTETETPESIDDPESEPEETTEESPTEEPTEEPTPRPDPTPEPGPEPTPEPTPDPSPTPSPTPSESPGTGEGTGPSDPKPGDGDGDDRDAEATSLIDMPNAKWRLGRPLAAEGLELRPRRLQIPLMTWNKIRPRQTPVVELVFDRTGRPTKGTRLATGSGDELLDGYLRDALDRWRATGRRLEELEGDETTLVRLRLLLK